VHEELVRSNHVASEQTTAASAGSPGRSTLLALFALAGSLALANLAQLGAHALALGTPFGPKPLALGPFLLARFTLGDFRRAPRFARSEPARALVFLGSRLGDAATCTDIAPRVEQLDPNGFTRNPNQTPHQTVDQTTVITLEMIHHFPLRVSHGTTAVVK
jgi:hypothetical protein